jgi:hypothetical protein
MTDEIYSDGIGNIVVAGGVVRIDLMTLSATAKDANGNPAVEHKQRVIFSIEGFTRSLNKIQEATNALIKAGLIQQTKPGETSVVATVDPKAAQAGPGERKPPFP